MSPVVGFNGQKLENSHYKLVQRNKISYIQRINGKYYNDSTNKKSQQRNRNYKRQPYGKKNPIIKMKNVLDESTANLRMHKKESVNLKLEQ